jgi:L-arabinonolactonase
VEHDLPTTRLNDGRTDRQGRFVCGGMDEGEPQEALSAVYSLDGGRRVRRIIHGVRCANSICFSPDGTTMYFSDMPTGRILAYAYDTDSGTPHSPRVLADCSGMPGLPDGSTVDAEGFLWNARWGGARLVRYAPDGRMERVVPLPVTNPTCPGFGGPDLETLFVVSARFALRPEQLAAEPWAGGVFALDVGVQGLPECPFADA